MATAAAVQPTSGSSPKPRFWVTDAAKTNFKEKVRGVPPMNEEKLTTFIDDMVYDALKLEKVENILDGTEPAKLVHLGAGDNLFFALLKKSINPEHGDTAIVTIMTPSQVEKKLDRQWSKVGQKMGMPEAAVAKLQAVKPAPRHMPESNQPIHIPSPALKAFMITYIPDRDKSVRQYEEYTTPKEVEDRLIEIKAVPGSLRVYREIAVGYRIGD